MIGQDLVELSCSQENVDDRQTDIMMTIPLVLPRGKTGNLLKMPLRGQMGEGFFLAVKICVNDKKVKGNK